MHSNKDLAQPIKTKQNKKPRKIARRNINNLRYTNDTTLMAAGEKELKNLLMKVIEGVKKLT